MEISQIDWKRIKPRIGRWVRTESHAGQVYYDLESDLADPYTITQFEVDFEDESVSSGWRNELGGSYEEVPLTPEELAEAKRMIADCRIIELIFHIRPGADPSEEADALKSGYGVRLKISGGEAKVSGNHLDIADAISDGYISPWAEEDPRIEHDKATRVPEEAWGEWDA